MRKFLTVLAVLSVVLVCLPSAFAADPPANPPRIVQTPPAPATVPAPAAVQPGCANCGAQCQAVHQGTRVGQVLTDTTRLAVMVTLAPVRVVGHAVCGSCSARCSQASCHCNCGGHCGGQCGCPSCTCPKAQTCQQPACQQSHCQTKVCVERHVVHERVKIFGRKCR